MSLTAYFDRQRKKIDASLERCLSADGVRAASLEAAMRYAVLSGGKRIRPIFTLAACEAVGGRAADAMPAACAIELIHSYSLVHDDLPCMDDDDERRGQPTCHKKFGEETALLAGDALLTLAFRTLAASPATRSAAAYERRLASVRRVADAAGIRGMVGGQAVDIEFKSKEADLPTIEYINTHKSGALIAVAVETGATLGGGTPRQVESLYCYGKSVGLLFQIVDDILDREGYAKIIGAPEARREADTLAEKAKFHLKPFGPKGRVLAEIADFVLTRTY